MKDRNVYWVALNENTIPLARGSSFNICEYVQVPLRAEEPGAVSVKAALCQPLLCAYWNLQVFKTQTSEGSDTVTFPEVYSEVFL